MDEPEIKTNEMVRAIRDQMHEKTKHMSPQEFAAYIRREAALAEAEEARESRDSDRNAA